MYNKYENNNVIVILAILPILPLTTSFIATLLGSLSLLVVLILSSVIMYYMDNLIKSRYYEGILVLISVLVLSLIRLILSAIGFELIKKMGVYFSIISVNAIILYIYEYRIRKRLSIKSNLKDLSIGLILIIVFSIFRELIGTGLLNLSFRIGEYYNESFIDIRNLFSLFSSNDYTQGLTFLILPAGGFILLGFSIALYRYIKNKFKHRG